MENPIIKLHISAVIPPSIIASILKIPLEEVVDTIDRYETECLKIECDYFEKVYPQLQKSLQEFIQEIPIADRFEMRRQYLFSQIPEMKKDPTSAKSKRLDMEIKIFLGKIKGITPNMIARARDYPITDLIKSVRGKAHCPFHVDKTPSMDVRKNYYHCYSCHESGDTIDLLMKRDNLTFKQAVTKLNV